MKISLKLIHSRWRNIFPQLKLKLMPKTSALKSEYIYAYCSSLFIKMSDKSQAGKSSDEESKKKSKKTTMAYEKPRPLVASKVVVGPTFKTGNQTRKQCTKQYEPPDHLSAKAESKAATQTRKQHEKAESKVTTQTRKQHEKAESKVTTQTRKQHEKAESKVTTQTRKQCTKQYEPPDHMSAEAKVTTALTESVTNVKPGSCRQKSRSAQSENKKRQRQLSSASEGKAAHQHESSRPGSSKVTNKWRKMQHGSLDMSSTARRWHQVQQVPQGVPGMELSVMSYNILSQMLLEMHPDLYSQCRRQDLVWPYRGPAILREIIGHNADIICLQEVEADHWKRDIRPALNRHGYYGLYQKRVGQKPDGCAILYKKSKFSHIKFVPVTFFKGGILDRDNVGIIVLLKPNPKLYKGEVKKICVATTHLLFNPRRGDVKLAQLMLFLAEIDKVAALDNHTAQETLERQSAGGTRHQVDSSSFRHQSHQSQSLAGKAQACSRDVNIGQGTSGLQGDNPAVETPCSHQRYCPIILCGDFNAEPLCDLYRLITTGQLKYEGLVSRFICGQRDGIESGANVYLSSALLPTHLGVTETCQYLSVLHGRHNSQRSQSTTWNQFRRLDIQNPVGGDKSKNYSSEESQPSEFFQRSGSSTSGRMSGGKELAQKDKPQVQPVHETNCISQENIKDTQTENTLEENEELESNFHPPKTNSGRAYHSMNFKSVYSHFTDLRGPDGSKLLEVSSQHDKCSATVDYIFYTSSPSHSPRDLSSNSQLELLARYSLLTSKQTACTGHLPNALFPSDHLSLIARFFLR